MESENVISSADSRNIGKLQVTTWDDGGMTLEDGIQEIHMDNSEARQLRRHLNHPAQKARLGIQPPPLEEPEMGQLIIHLGRHLLLVTGKSISVGNRRGWAVLDEAETYRLFACLRELF